MSDVTSATRRLDPSGWSVRWDERRARALVESGDWRNVTMADLACRTAREDPDRVLIVEGAAELRAAQVWELALRLASALQARGLRPGDRISYQLPNWGESIVIDLAATLAGLVSNPLVPIYRQAEVGFMLGDCGSRLIFIPAEFRGYDYRAMMRDILPRLETGVHVVVLRGDAQEFESYEDLLGSGDAASPLPRVAPDAVKLVLYTSGTTGRPKGVLHTHNTVDVQGRQFGRIGTFSSSDRVLVASPVSHITGAILAFQLPWIVGSAAVLMDRWSGEEALDLIASSRCTIMSGATPFLRDLYLAARARGETLPSLRVFLCGGAAVPPDLIHEASAQFTHCAIFRCYGCTEVPTTVAGIASREALGWNAQCDGRPQLSDLKLVDPATGLRARLGDEGEVVMRGPQMMLGYLRDEDNAEAFDDEGYFRTGDLARTIHDEWIAITGRKKDLIIRAGENLSPKEVEDVLLAHPLVDEVAIVGFPSLRTGEAACAFVVARDGASFGLEEIARFLVERGLARQKIPERLEFVASLPKTASGKVQKNVLREWAAAG